MVDSSAKASFEKVLGTWPNWTSQLFPKELIAKIEQGVRSMRQQKQGSYQPSSSHGKPPHADRSREDPYSQNASNMVRDTCTSADWLFPSVKNKDTSFFVAFLLGTLSFHLFFYAIRSDPQTGYAALLVTQDQYALFFGIPSGNKHGDGHEHEHGQGYRMDTNRTRRALRDDIREHARLFLSACTAETCSPLQQMCCTASQIKETKRKKNDAQQRHIAFT